MKLRRFAWLLFGLSVVFAGLFASLVAGGWGPEEYRHFLWLTALYVLLTVTFPFLGALIASRHPRNGIGWMFCAAGIALGLGFSAQLYAHDALAVTPSLAGGHAAAWASSWLVPAGLFVAPIVLLYIFPDGRPLSRRWSLLLRTVLAAVAAGFLGMMFAPGPLETFPEIRNPFPAPGTLSAVAKFLAAIGGFLVGPTAVFGIVALIVRFGRSRGERRQQMKAIVYPAVVMAVAFALTFAFSALKIQALADIAFVTGILGVIGIFVGATLGILKYGLYEIDVVINRTLVYGSLTVILAAAYFGLVALFQTVLAPLTEGSDLAVVASTLAVAALFRPARARIQAFIDRRFYRSRYDATKTLEAFGARLRNEVELPALRAGVIEVVHDTLQPAHASLWLRVDGR